MKFYVAENDATMTAGLQILGQASDDGEIDVTIGAGVASTTTVSGGLVVSGSTATVGGNYIYRAGGTDVAIADGGTGQSNLTNLITLGTHTTGNYAATITAGTGLTSTGATSGESIAHSLLSLIHI